MRNFFWMTIAGICVIIGYILRSAKKLLHRLYLDIYIEIPLLTVQTMVNHYALCSRTLEITSLAIKFWKWKTKFRLYAKEY